jgi:UDP-2,4-diacetamido-2,4,6-trideoxy-beta-L-altropyranose hydrolase
VIVTNASIVVGGGHVRRCRVLADALISEGWSVTLAVSEEALSVYPILSRYTIARITFRLSDLARQLIDVLPGGCDLLVVDHYDLDVTFEAACRPWATRVFVIDDLANRMHDCDWLVDQTPGRMPADYAPLLPPGRCLMLGPGYALLDARFRACRNTFYERNEVRRVLVSFGSTDPGGMTGLALQGLEQSGLEVEIDIVLGASSPNLENIKCAAAGLDRHANVHVDVDDMASLVVKADLAVGAGGVSALERCCLGVPSVVLVVAENQRGNVEGLVRAGAAISFSAGSAVSPQTLGKTLRELAFDSARRRSMSHAGRRLCDALGPDRVMNALNRTITPDRGVGPT